ncbi:MAG: ABC transporter ATP-binding protein [Haloarculaceae archaeon]
MTLRLTDLRTDYPSFGLGPLSVTVEPGVTAVLGPSGSGKSTLLSLVAGFETPGGGTVSLAGRRIDGLPPEKRGVGMVFQDDALFPHLSVRENLAFGEAATADVDSICALLEIGDLLDRGPATLSGGERQRVALARTLVADPEALLLDEPLASLDAPIRRRLRLDLREILGDLGVPVVYVTHDRDEAAVVADRLAIVFDGDLVQTGPVEAVFDEPATPTVARFLGWENVLPGTVTGSDGSETRVQVGSTSVLATGHPASGEVRVAMRPGAIDLREPSAASESNTLAATVRRVVPQYDEATVVLEVDGVGRLTASVDLRTGESLTPGQELVAAVPPEDVRTIPGAI